LLETFNKNKNEIFIKSYKNNNYNITNKNQLIYNDKDFTDINKINKFNLNEKKNIRKIWSPNKINKRQSKFLLKKF
jgi:hypothetical protein